MRFSTSPQYSMSDDNKTTSLEYLSAKVCNWKFYTQRSCHGRQSQVLNNSQNVPLKKIFLKQISCIRYSPNQEMHYNEHDLALEEKLKALNIW